MRYAVPFIPQKKNIIALTLHNIPDNKTSWFEQTISYIHDKYGFINPGQVLVEDKKVHSGRVLLTFDDGFESNIKVCRKFLDPLGIKAVFFISSGFIDCSEDDAFNFAQNFIFPSRPIMEKDGSMRSMTWEDICSLSSTGHYIGGHTHSHQTLKSLTQDEKRREILMSADEIEQQISAPVNLFAYPFGNLNSVNREAVYIASERFSMAFSNIRGGIDESDSRYFLFRQNIEPGTPLWLVDAILLGKLDWKYVFQRKKANKEFRAIGK